MLFGRGDLIGIIMLMNTSSSLILTVNAGSSSLKVSVFDADHIQQASFRVENIGQPQVTFTARITSDSVADQVDVKNHQDAVRLIFDQLFIHYPEDRFAGIGHRITHGGPYFDSSVRMTTDVLQKLRDITVFDPLHLPLQVQVAELVKERLEDIPHVACFDTTFFHGMPRRAKLLPLPRHYYEAGIRRYGFHGLSYSYLLDELRQIEGGAAADGKVILAHLGSGASVTAVEKGVPVDTTMSLTPLSGIMMSTRSGDLDPGLPAVLRSIKGVDQAQFDTIVASESGLRGVSGMSADMALLIKEYRSNPAAADAVDLFCYQVQKTIGAFVAALGGLDTLVFSGGIGENAPFIRRKVIEGLSVFGLEIDDTANDMGDRIISTQQSNVAIRTIKTNEEQVIAKETYRLVVEKG